MIDREHLERHVDEEPVRRQSPPDGVPGAALVLTIVGIPLLVLIIIAVVALWLAAPSSGHRVPSSVAVPPVTADAQSGAPLGWTARAGSPWPDGALQPPAAAAVRGVATWYDAPSSSDAAAGPALRRALGKHWRGSTVRVCAGGCVTVRLTDWCACAPRNGRPTVIDLDDQAFAAIAKLSAGVVRVKVTVTGQIDVPLTSVPTAPPTDVEQ